MVEIRLHGDLARQFGRVWHLNISTPLEAIAAIEANTVGFRRKIRDLGRKGVQFRVRTSTHEFKNEDVHCTVGSQKRLDIIPILVGANAGVRFVVGAALLALSFIPSPLSPYLASTGVCLMLGSVVEWLTPQAKRKDNPGGVNSWSLDGPSNTVDQGLPVPIIYGEVLAGAYTISGGISVSQLNPADTSSPLVQIGGETAQTTRAVAPGTATFLMSVGAVNLTDPLSYTWSYSGFSTATAVRALGAGSATLTLEVDYAALDYDQTLDIVGQVSVEVVGVKPNTSASGEPETALASANQTIHLYLSNLYEANGGGDGG